MQAVRDGQYPGASAILFMPMIDQKSPDPGCVYSTMIFACKQVKKYNSTPILTFDQPLYWISEYIIKVSSNVDSVLSNFVMRLGGFHMCMLVYDVFRSCWKLDNTVPKMLDDKAEQHAHILYYTQH